MNSPGPARRDWRGRGEGAILRSMTYQAIAARIRVYLIATGAVLIALILKLLTPAAILPEIPFLLFFSAVMVSGTVGGWGPGLYAAVLSAAAADYVFLPPYHTLLNRDWHQDYKVILYIVDCVTIIVLCQRLRTALARARALEHSETEARRALEIAKVEADRANAFKSAFLANMSHEIRTPLGAILGYAELLRDDASEIEKDRLIAVILRNGRNLNRLIDDVLDLAKVEANQIEVERVAFAPAQVVDDVVDLFRGGASAKNLTFEATSPDGPPPPIASDPTRFAQILTNVVGNAIKFTSAGAVTIEVRWQSARDDHVELTCAVTDSGIGLTPEQRGRLFQPFVQGDSSTTRAFGGTGLGLAISKRLAHALGGDVRTTASAPGAGSTFVITLLAPRADVTATLIPPTRRSDPPPTPITAAAPMAGRRHVLVADDSPDNRFLISRMLELSDFRVATVENGREAVEAAQNGEFDVVLMDIQMPLMDGYEATRALRAGGFTKPIVALTAHAMREEALRTRAAGCDAHLSKPIDRAELVRTIVQLIGS